MNQLYSGMTELVAPASVVNDLFKGATVPLHHVTDDLFFENQYAVIHEAGAASHSVLCRINGDEIKALQKYETAGIRARNKEQYFALDALMDPNIRVAVLTGRAGVGKSVLAIAAAIALIQQKRFKKIILTRPSSQVGKRELGILPGNVEEKFLPYLVNFTSNMDVLFGGRNKQDVQMLFQQYNIEIVPMQLLRGASFNDSIILADEQQVTDHHEMLTLGTRISERSKIVLMGDFQQRDEPIAIEETGLFKFLNDPHVKDSKFCASVHMTKVERGEVSALFSKVFEAGAA